jgi:hypothetical protein
MKTEGIADRISLLKLVEHVGRNLGPQLAAHSIHKKWAAGELRIWVHWLIKEPIGEIQHQHELMSNELLRKLERGGGIPWKRLVKASESGVDLDKKTAFLFASRADAARFWPWEASEGSKRITGRKLSPGAPTPYDWEGALIAGAVWMLKNGVPKRKSTLINHVHEWFGADGPAESQVKKHIGPLYDAFLEASLTKSTRGAKETTLKKEVGK